MSRQLGGAKFRRQHPIGPYIVDSCCPEAKLVIEIDGGQHAAAKEADARRTAFLEAQGYRVLRFWDNEGLARTQGVLEPVLGALEERRHAPHPALSPEGRGT